MKKYGRCRKIKLTGLVSEQKFKIYLSSNVELAFNGVLFKVKRYLIALRISSLRFFFMDDNLNKGKGMDYGC